MKKNLYLLLTLITIVSVAGSCKKQELADTYPKVVQVSLSGGTAVQLEFVYNEAVVAAVDSGSGFQTNIRLDIEGESAELQVREANSGKVIKTLEIASSTFEHSLSIYYDGANTYDRFISYALRGFATSGELEFVLDGRVVGEGSSNINHPLDIYLNEGEQRQLQIRRKGETEPLLSQTVDTESDGKELRFFFDGSTMIDDIPELSPPSKPENMSITGQFSTVMTPAGNMGAIFTGDAEVDLVFYIRNTSDEVTVPDPAIRVTVPTNGTFVTFELPPLPDENSFYTYDICKKGSDEIPYKDFVMPDLFPPGFNRGQYGQLILGENGSYFTPGTSKLLLLQDFATVGVFDLAFYIHGQVIDLSQYFTTEE